MTFAVERIGNDGSVRVAVRGELDMATGPQVDEELLRAEAEATRRLVLDLTGVTFFDSTGMQVVLDAEVRSREAAYELVIAAAADGEVLRVMELASVRDRLVVELDRP